MSKPENLVAEIREGTAQISIWKNKGDKGDFYTASAPKVRYQKDGEWRDSKSYDDFDLECVALACLSARKRLRQLRGEAKQASEAASESPEASAA